MKLSAYWLKYAHAPNNTWSGLLLHELLYQCYMTFGSMAAKSY